MTIENLLKDYDIPFVLPEDHHHATDGWVNIHCPFCAGSKNYHLGISTDGKGCHCWRCGSHSALDSLSAAMRKSKGEVRELLRQYLTKTPTRRKIESKVSIYPFKFPTPNSPLGKISKKYLSNRDFDPDLLEKEWALFETGPVSYLDNINYGRRIIAPINWKNDTVTFQARDITGKSEIKYLTCPKKREKIHHKNIAYGKQHLWADLEALIIVEGIADAWRLGNHSAAVFGIEFTTEQVLQLSKQNDRFFIIFDTDPQAKRQARKLSTKLKTLGKEVYIETLKEGDPGDMSQDDADHLVKNLVRRLK